MKKDIFLIFLYTFITLCELKPQQHQNETELQLVFIIFRHGERVPETNEQFPNDPYPIESFYPLTYGEIIKEGKRRQFRFGQKLRTKYNDFLGPIYKADNVVTYTTEFDRTKTSALLALAGLFPPHPSEIWDPEIKWLPIPYSYKSQKTDFLIQRPDPYCPRYVKHLEQIYQSDTFKNITEKYKEIVDYISEKSGRNIFDFHEMLRLYQNIHLKKLMNITTPEWTNSIYPEPIHTIASYQCVFENFDRQLIKLNGGHILQKFIEMSQQKMNGTLEPRDRKMFLYSGHENNIVNILAVLGLYKQHIPPYCSGVMLELHKIKASGEFGFKVYYENNTYEDGHHLMIIPGCEELCSFNKFLTITHDVVPVNYTAECESDVYLD